MFIYHVYGSSSSLMCSFMLSACYNQQMHKVLHVCSLLCHYLTTNTVPVITQCLLYTTPNFITRRYNCTRYMNYRVNMFFGLNWNRTASIFLSSICIVIMLLYLVQTTMTLSFDIKSPQTSLIHTELDTV